ncbi:response regulator [Rhodoblastus sphagnicola]|uniref:Response regulator n=1 Tax=Rhodoblastus sphagnicola TaxID=333368 RepID=A0A2S6N1M3_9HYPH|nr:response regulator [Rhodoblastus sphagnicola]MBB4199185.1 CheY-like chemotaxis protein [Rhodoblastus sphagnicola]PPQ28512.1 response regulator [Rhodoblastus sphagnicola]
MFRILLIEDDLVDVYLFKTALEQSMAKDAVAVEHVCDGLEAVLRVSRLDVMDKLPDVLVLDLNMPRFDGISFLHSLRKSLLLQALPVFVLTTSTESDRHREATSAGANRVYVKPDRLDALAAITREIVDASMALNSVH